MLLSNSLGRIVTCAALSVLLMGVWTAPACAQATSTNTISGLVTDQQNAAIPDATVTLIDVATNTSQTATTNQAGRFVFVNLDSGAYSIVITKQGFNSYRVASQRVEVGSSISINATLEIGSTATTVEVTATSAELQTTNATVGSTISSNAIMFLPNMGRDVSTLAILQPAVSPASSSYGGAAGFTAGAFNDQNTYMLDGGNISDDMAGNTTGYQTNFTGLGGSQSNAAASGVIPTPIESIEEVRVSVFNQSADFNNSTGGQVQMVTKRGTNDYHGSGYGYYFATNVGAANYWEKNHTPFVQNGVKLGYTPLPSNHRDRFGASLGGPIMPWKVLGGKWYAFFNYEGLRFPNVGTYERLVPSPELRAGVIQVPDSSGKYVAYNLNPGPVNVNGVTYQPATCPAGACDPRSIGLNPVVNQLWSKYMPLPNDPNYGSGDGHNTMGYQTTIRAPLTTNNYIGRIDHDFSDKWRWMTSYRYQRLVSITTNQVDIGGALPGDQFGVPTATAPRPQVDGYFVTGLTTNITANVTNDFRYAYLRQFWQWGTAQAPPQLPGLGGALEIYPGGTSAASSAENINALIPYNVNSQNIRQRFWDGHDNQLQDNITMIKGNHLFQFGGSYQRNYDYHTRTDNGIGINNQIIYWLGNYGQGNWTNSPYIPSTVPGSQTNFYENLYGAVTGIVAQSQVAYTRAGTALNIQPLGSVAFDQSIIPYYNVYFGDTWHMKPSLSITYGLAYALEMPPYEINGKQVALVDQSDNLVYFNDYIAQRKKAALAGQVYNPILGFALVRNVGKGLKYPYNPFYGQFSPRLAVAWNPQHPGGLLGKLLGDGKTVVRGGYSRIYGRINGVNQVLVPLLGPGLLQGVICNGATTGGTCLGSSQATPLNAFRIGVDGNTAPLASPTPTLAQPFIPGGTNTNAGDSTALDPNYRPNRTDNFSLSVQRQISRNMVMDVGYIGRIDRNDYMEVNIDSVPYMTTLGGQTFAQAFANLYSNLCGGAYPCPSTASPANAPVQPFLEAALGGNAAYCSGYSSCTAAFASKNTSSIRNALVSSLWSSLNSAWTLGRSMISSPLNGGANQANSISMVGSFGHSNYNALYASWKAQDWHGLTATSNFTWGRALGTAEYAQYNSSVTTLDPYDLDASYGPQLFDIKFVYNASMYYQPPFFKGEKGVLGRLLGGWVISPLFTAQSGGIAGVGYAPGSYTQAFGESSSSSVNANSENSVGAAPYTGGNTLHYNVPGSNGIGTNNPYGVNMFSNPAAVYAEFRPCILGIDTSCGGFGNFRTAPRWNLDASVSKDVRLASERVGMTFIFLFTNVMNHNIMNDAPGSTNFSLSLTSPSTFGRITAQGNTPRNMEFGLRIHF